MRDRERISLYILVTQVMSPVRPLPQNAEPFERYQLVGSRLTEELAISINSADVDNLQEGHKERETDRGT